MQGNLLLLLVVLDNQIPHDSQDANRGRVRLRIVVAVDQEDDSALGSRRTVPDIVVGHLAQQVTRDGFKGVLDQSLDQARRRGGGRIDKHLLDRSHSVKAPRELRWYNLCPRETLRFLNEPVKMRWELDLLELRPVSDSVGIWLIVSHGGLHIVTGVRFELEFAWTRWTQDFKKLD